MPARRREPTLGDRRLALTRGPTPPLELLREFIARRAFVDQRRVLPESRLIDFGLDSVKAMDLLVELEQAYGLSIPDEDLADLRTVGEVAGYLERRLERPGG